MAPRPSGFKRRYSSISDGGDQSSAPELMGRSWVALGARRDAVLLDLHDEGAQRHADELGGAALHAAGGLERLQHARALELTQLLGDVAKALATRRRGGRAVVAGHALDAGDLVGEVPGLDDVVLDGGGDVLD